MKITSQYSNHLSNGNNLYTYVAAAADNVAIRVVYKEMFTIFTEPYKL